MREASITPSPNHPHPGGVDSPQTSPVEPTIPGSRRCPHSSVRGMWRPCTRQARIRAWGAHEAGQAALWTSQL